MSWSGARAALALIFIPAGSYVPFFAGQARQPVQIQGFWLDSAPVSRGQFSKFVRSHPEWQRSGVKRLFAEPSYLQDWATDLEPGASAAPNAPVVQVSWFAARAYCESRGMSLPTTDQWEYAANTRGRGPNGFGIRGPHHLLWEWTEDFANSADGLNPDAFSCGAGAINAIDTSNYAAFMRYSYRSSLSATFTTRNLGFRCIKEEQP